MSVQSLGGGEKDNASEPNNSSSLSLAYILSKSIPTVPFKWSFSSLETFGAFSGSRTSPPWSYVPTLMSYTCVLLLFFLNFRLSVIFLL